MQKPLAEGTAKGFHVNAICVDLTASAAIAPVVAATTTTVATAAAVTATTATWVGGIGSFHICIRVVGRL
jgi:hypothetical protein